MKAGELRGGDTWGEGAQEMPNLRGDAMPKEGVELIWGKDTRLLGPDSFGVEEEGRKEGLGPNGFIETSTACLTNAKTKLGAPMGEPSTL